MLYRLILTAGLIAFGQSALACACCADKADRVSERLERSVYEDEEFALLREMGSSWVHVTACGFDCVTGLEVGRHTYDLGLTMRDGVFQLENSIGVMRLPLGDGFDHFAVDADPMDDSREPRLYREFRFNGVMAATGMFAQAGGAKAELVLAGRGNSCWSSGDFKQWFLTVKSEKVDFRLYGELFNGSE